MTAAKRRPLPREASPRPLLRALPAPPLEAVEKRQRKRRPGLAAAACAAICLGVFANVAFTAVTARTQFRLERLERQADEAEARYHRRRLEVATLEAPQRVVNEAQRLGMVQPEKVTYLTPTAETTATDSAPAVGGRERDGATGGAPSWTEVKPHLNGGG
jgi:hypothetical protein